MINLIMNYLQTIKSFILFIFIFIGFTNISKTETFEEICYQDGVFNNEDRWCFHHKKNRDNKAARERENRIKQKTIKY